MKKKYIYILMEKIILIVIVCSFFVAGQMPTKPPILPQVEDIPFIQCDVCQRAAKALFKEVRSLRDEKKPGKLSEEEILNIVEKACDPNSMHGKWMRYLDIVENKDSLKLQEHSNLGKCKEECKTIARSCDQSIGDIDTDIGEILWQNELKLSSFLNEVCYSLSNTCKKSKHKFVKGIRTDFKFVEMTEKDIEAEKYVESMRGMPGMPGMELYSKEDLEKMRNDIEMEHGIKKPDQQSEREEKQSIPNHYQTQLSFFDTVKEAGNDILKKAKRLFGYKEEL